MPIVDKKSNAYDSTANNVLTVVDGRFNRAELRAAVGSVANLSTDSNGSVYRLWTMPSRGILRAETCVDLTAWGYAAATLGLARNLGATLTANGLATTITIASLSGAFTAPIALFGAKWGMPVWQAAGLSADPGGLVDVIIATAANATGAGSAKFDALWQID